MAEVDVLIEAQGWAELPEIEAHVIAAACATLAFVIPDFSAQEKADAQSLAVLLGDDAALKRLNHQFREQDKPTNVLSFPAGKRVDGFLGDIAIAYETCQQEAASEDKSIRNHLTHLVVHGTLHLLGYDHETNAEAEVMEDIERKILAQLGIADPYHNVGDLLPQGGAS